MLTEIGKKLENLNIDYNDYVGCYVEGYNLEKKTFTITSTTSGVTSDKDTNGNTISDNIAVNGDQTFETETDMKWRIWDYDGTTIRLISEKPTDAILALKGADGYNNGVWAINEICRQCYGKYDNNGKMKEGINVANLRRSDIQKVIKYDYTSYIYNDNVVMYKYGNTESYITNNYYPKIWENYDEKWKYYIPKNSSDENKPDSVKTNEKESIEDKEGMIWEEEGKVDDLIDSYCKGDENIEFKQSFWGKELVKDDFCKSEYYNLIIGVNKDSWLACRCTWLKDGGCWFGMQRIARK